MTDINFPSGAVVKNLPANAGDARDAVLTSELERSPREGNGNSLQYPCLENPMDGEAWQATVHEVAELDTIKHYSLVLYNTYRPTDVEKKLICGDQRGKLREDKLGVRINRSTPLYIKQITNKDLLYST